MTHRDPRLKRFAAALTAYEYAYSESVCIAQGVRPGNPQEAGDKADRQRAALVERYRRALKAKP